MSPEIFEVDLDKIQDDPDNPRQDFGTDADEQNLANSLLKHQDYPILIRAHPTLAGFFLIVDGHRRTRAARRVGMKKLRAMSVKAGLTEAEIRLIMLRTDLHKKKLTDGERLTIIRKAQADHPNLNGKQFAELLEMDTALLSRFKGLDRLIPKAMDAFLQNLLGLKAAHEISQLAPDDQPALLAIRLDGGTVADMTEERKKRKAPGARSETDNFKLEKLPVALGDGAVIIKARKGEEALNLATARLLLLAALAKVDSAIKAGWSAKTAARAFEETKDKAPEVKKARKPRSTPDLGAAQ